MRAVSLSPLSKHVITCICSAFGSSKHRDWTQVKQVGLSNKRRRSKLAGTADAGETGRSDLSRISGMRMRAGNTALTAEIRLLFWMKHAAAPCCCPLLFHLHPHTSIHDTKSTDHNTAMQQVEAELASRVLAAEPRQAADLNWRGTTVALAAPLGSEQQLLTSYCSVQ